MEVLNYKLFRVAQYLLNSLILQIVFHLDSVVISLLLKCFINFAFGFLPFLIFYFSGLYGNGPFDSINLSRSSKFSYLYISYLAQF